MNRWKLRSIIRSLARPSSQVVPVSPASLPPTPGGTGIHITANNGNNSSSSSGHINEFGAINLMKDNKNIAGFGKHGGTTHVMNPHFSRLDVLKENVQEEEWKAGDNSQNIKYQQSQQPQPQQQQQVQSVLGELHPHLQVITSSKYDLLESNELADRLPLKSPANSFLYIPKLNVIEEEVIVQEIPGYNVPALTGRGRGSLRHSSIVSDPDVDAANQNNSSAADKPKVQSSDNNSDRRISQESNRRYSVTQAIQSLLFGEQESESIDGSYSSPVVGGADALTFDIPSRHGAISITAISAVDALDDKAIDKKCSTDIIDQAPVQVTSIEPLSDPQVSPQSSSTSLHQQPQQPPLPSEEDDVNMQLPRFDPREGKVSPFFPKHQSMSHGSIKSNSTHSKSGSSSHSNLHDLMSRPQARKGPVSSEYVIDSINNNSSVLSFLRRDLPAVQTAFSPIPPNENKPESTKRNDSASSQASYLLYDYLEFDDPYNNRRLSLDPHRRGEAQNSARSTKAADIPGMMTYPSSQRRNDYLTPDNAMVSIDSVPSHSNHGARSTRNNTNNTSNHGSSQPPLKGWIVRDLDSFGSGEESPDALDNQPMSTRINNHPTLHGMLSRGDVTVLHHNQNAENIIHPQGENYRSIAINYDDATVVEDFLHSSRISSRRNSVQHDTMDQNKLKT